MSEQQRLARVYLSSVAKPAGEMIRRLVAAHGPVHVAEQVAGMGAVRRDWELAAVRDLDHARRHDLSFLAPEDRSWPAALRQAPTGQDQPLGFWVRGTGDLATLLRRAVVVLGADSATPYASQAAFGMGAELVAAGCGVVSTGGYGVASAVQRGVLTVGRPMVVLPAGGMASPGPIGHRRLFDRTAGTGLLISESLRTPGRAVDQQRRAWLAAAAGAAVVLIEPQRNGLTGTAIRLARQLGRPLLVLPAPVTSDRSAYAHQLLRDGIGRLIRGYQDVLVDLPAAEGAR